MCVRHLRRSACDVCRWYIYGNKYFMHKLERLMCVCLRRMRERYKKERRRGGEEANEEEMLKKAQVMQQQEG